MELTSNNVDVETSSNQQAIFEMVLSAVKLFANTQNIDVYGLDNLVNILKSRQQGIITIANHQSDFDDPIIWSPLDWNQINVETFRWIMAAREHIEASSLLSYLAPNLKIILINRKEAHHKDSGLHQEAIFTANEKLAKNHDWVHLFPEGRLFQDYGRFIGTFKHGLAHLIMSCDKDLAKELNKELIEKNIINKKYISSTKLPILIPIVHFGMHNVKPLYQNPNILQNVHIFYGEPINLTDILQQLKIEIFIGTEKRLEHIRTFLTAHIETKYLQFYLLCFEQVYGFMPKDIYPNDTGYFQNQNAIKLAKLSKQIYYLRSTIAKLSNDEKSSPKYPEELNKYITLLKEKGNHLNFITINEKNLTDYDKERLSYNLYGVQHSIENTEKQLYDWNKKYCSK